MGMLLAFRRMGFRWKYIRAPWGVTFRVVQIGPFRAVSVISSRKENLQ